MPDASYRAALGARKESCLVPVEEFDELRAVEPVAWSEIGLAGLSGKFVPGAEQLAIVAAVYPVANRLAKFDRYRVLRFDREIRNAATGVEKVGRDDCVGRANVEAGRAGAAVCRCGSIDGQRQVRV
jgi:hypothetical protein